MLIYVNVKTEKKKLKINLKKFGRLNKLPYLCKMFFEMLAEIEKVINPRKESEVHDSRKLELV